MSDIRMISSYSKQLSTTRQKTISQVVRDNVTLPVFTGSERAAAGGEKGCSFTCCTPTLPPSALLALQAFVKGTACEQEPGSESSLVALQHPFAHIAQPF